jgi:hypothetical protein
VPTSHAIAVSLTAAPFPLTHGIVRGIPERSRRARLPLSSPELDRLFGGGLPCGAITEVCGPRSSGRTALAHRLLAAVIAGGEYVAWVDLPNALDPTYAETAGVTLERVLWMHPADTRSAFRATEYVLSGGGFRLVVLDLDDPTRGWPTVSTSNWLRVTRAAVRQHAAVVVLSTTHVVGTFAALSLDVSLRRRVFVGAEGPACLFAGMTSAFRLRKNKLGPLGSAPVEFFLSTAA